jgi:oligopeptide/dipeptide ABC transporter ATP-binding protein
VDSSAENEHSSYVGATPLAQKPVLLSVRHLRTHLDKKDAPLSIVEDVSFDLHQGEVLGLVGESGAGKTMLCRTLMGLFDSSDRLFLDHDETSRIDFEGIDLIRCSEAQWNQIRGKRIAMIFQDPMSALNPYLSIQAQLNEVLIYHKNLSKSAATKRSIEMLDRVGIEQAHRRIKQYPHEFSGGMRQRVVLAMALLCEPSLIIADEPTTALDASTQKRLLSLLQSLRAEFELSMIWVSHDLSLISQIADTVAVMYAGRVVEQAPAADLFNRAQHPYTRELIACVPSLYEPKTERLATIEGQAPSLSSLPRGCSFHPRCSQATDKCKESYPDTRQHSTRHWSACFLDEVQS